MLSKWWRKNSIYKWVVLTGRKTLKKNSIKGGLIITATTTEIVFVLNAANVKPPCYAMLNVMPLKAIKVQSTFYCSKFWGCWLPNKLPPRQAWTHGT